MKKKKMMSKYKGHNIKGHHEGEDFHLVGRRRRRWWARVVI